MRHTRPWAILFWTCLLLLPRGAKAVDGTTRRMGVPEEGLFQFQERSGTGQDGVEARVNEERMRSLIRQPGKRVIALPVGPDRYLELELEPFRVRTTDCRVYVAGQRASAPPPDMIHLRGEVQGDPGSSAYLSLAANGSVQGWIRPSVGLSYGVSSGPATDPGSPLTVFISRIQAGDLPDFAALCGVTSEGPVPRDGAARLAPDSSAGPFLAFVALDSDQDFFDLFGDATDAETYLLQLLGVVSDIYIRDLGIHLVVDFIRLWPGGGEPFGADDLSGFSNYWTANEDLTGLNYVLLMSGRRDLSYGGVAWLSSPCSGGAFCISGYLNGSFSAPLQDHSIANWDIIVTAHEMGHNSGTLHTHDGYTPTIDDCGNGTPAQGTIMSYCHTFAGYTSNIDLRFHTRVQEVIESTYRGDGCLPGDCNLNGRSDSADIALATSMDANGDGIPDECQDCDANGVLDPSDIQGGAPDINANGIPDACEPDCNGNGLPDRYETRLGFAADADGNNVPDVCDPDCDGNGQIDFLDIALGIHTDYDRNRVPDVCQDCNGNFTPDWIDIGRPHQLYVADLTGYVREYHARSGVPVQNYGSLLSSPRDVVFGADRRLYIASFDNDRIVRLDPETGAMSTFVPSGAGGLSGAAALAFGPDGHLYVASRANSRILRYDGATGSFLNTFVAEGSGGLQNPWGLEFGPNDHLYVASDGDHSVKEYGPGGAFVGHAVAPGAGGLSGPRDLVFKPDGNLLVTSYNTDEVLEYVPGGAFVRVFNDDVTPTSPWGITIGPNGNVFVVRNQGTIRVLEYDPQTGRYYRSFVRGDPGLTQPAGLAFRPGSPLDCNDNGVPDSCDIAAGTSLDLDFNGVPDECDMCVDSDGDGYGDPGTGGGCPEDNCPEVFNPDQEDSDGDSVGDSCDVCAGFSDLVDSDADGVPDGCDVCAGFPDALDADTDGVPDGCDVCPGFDDLLDSDGDTVPDGCDVCAGLDDLADADFDGVPDGCDVCPGADDLLDGDGDGVPDGCDACAGFDDLADADVDGTPDSCDNCPEVVNPGQDDFDGDGLGDACDSCLAVDVPANGTLTPGDVNADGQVTSADLVYMVAHIFRGGPDPAPVPETGDADCSGVLNSADIIVLVNFVFKSGAPPCDVCAVL